MIKENEIRPEELVKKQQEFIKQDIAFLLSQKDKFVSISCPACETNNEEIEFNKNGFDYIECQNCGMLYVSPRPVSKLLGEFYLNSPNYKFFNDYIFPASKETRKEKIFKPRVNKVIDVCKKHNVNTDKIIEIGAGFGLFCEEIAKTAFFKEVVGLEASDSLFETCKDKGFRIYNGILETLKIDEKFNVAVAFEVIEHIFNPYEFLKITNKLLDDNGFLMLTFPNYEGFDINLLKEKSVSVDHEHLNYFTGDSISILLEKTGFNVIDIKTPGMLDVDLVRKEIVNNNYNPEKFIKNVCVDKFDTLGHEFQKFLSENGLSSHMMVIAKKVGE